MFRLEIADNENRELITTTNNLFCDASDDVLVRFLRARKFDSGRAWDLMKGERPKYWGGSLSFEVLNGKQSEHTEPDSEVKVTCLHFCTIPIHQKYLRLRNSTSNLPSHPHQHHNGKYCEQCA